MRVVQINACYPKGSTGCICKDISDYLISKGDISLVISGIKEDNNCNEQVSISNIFLIKANSLLSRISGVTSYGNYVSTKKAIKIIESFKPDIIHLHNVHGNYINIKKILVYIAKMDIPLVITLHDCWFFTGKCTHYTSVKCDKWVQGCYNCPKLKSDIPSYFFDKTNKVWNERKKMFNSIKRIGVIGVSEWITNQAKIGLFPQHANFRKIYNWIDTDIFYPRHVDECSFIRKHSIPKKNFYILFVSAKWDVKTDRVNDLLKLSSKISDDIGLLLVGDCDPKIELPKNIINLGHISDLNELAEIYSFADVYIHLSREDSFGKVIAESLACGTPAIAYDQTACPEIIGKNCGYVCKTGDIESIIKYINIIKKSNLNNANYCTEYVSKNFLKEDKLSQTHEYYRFLINYRDAKK